MNTAKPLNSASDVPRNSRRTHARIVAVLLALAAGACRLASPSATATTLEPLPALTVRSDEMHVDTVAPGVQHWRLRINQGPWAINVLDVDRSACWTPVALKAGGRAVGREKTSVLVRAYADSMKQRDITVIGGVNADFFSFAPPGVPATAHVHRGRTLAGPTQRPVFALSPDNSLYFGVITLLIGADHGGVRTSARWNHPTPTEISVVDNAYGERTDTATGALEIVFREIALRTRQRPGSIGVSHRMVGVVTAVDTAATGVPVPAKGFLLYAGSRADTAGRQFARRLSVGDTVHITRAQGAPRPLEAIGGFPLLLRYGLPHPDVHTAGSPGFRGRHPRTAVGAAANGRRIFLVTVDGRQPGYSDGMSLAELADLMQQLGARDALNLDGGGSTTLVVADSTGQFAIANRPSDREGERPVANALAIERICRKPR